MIAAAHVRSGVDVRVEGDTWRIVSTESEWGAWYGHREGTVLRFGAAAGRFAYPPMTLLPDRQPQALNTSCGWRFFDHDELLEVVA